MLYMKYAHISGQFNWQLMIHLKGKNKMKTETFFFCAQYEYIYMLVDLPSIAWVSNMLNMINNFINNFYCKHRTFAILIKRNNFSIFYEYPTNVVLFIYILLIWKLTIFVKWTIMTTNELKSQL